MTLRLCVLAPCPVLHLRRCVRPSFRVILRHPCLEPAACPLCGRLPVVSLVGLSLSSLLLMCPVLFDLLNGCSVWLVSHRGGLSLSAAVCVPAPFLGRNLQRDCAVFGSMREANVTVVVPSAGVAVPGACWYCAWCQWYEVCCGSSGVFIFIFIFFISFY